MSRPPLSVVETPAFIRSAKAIWNDDEIDALILFVALEPEAGDLIPDTGGLRKLRWNAGGRGRRGGARVIYYFHDDDVPLFLFAAYAKSERADLTPEQKRAGRSFVQQLKARFRRGD